MAAAYLTVRVQSRVFLQDMDAIPPFNMMKVVTKPASGAGQPGAPCKGSLSFANFPGKYDLIDLG